MTTNFIPNYPYRTTADIEARLNRKALTIPEDSVIWFVKSTSRKVKGSDDHTFTHYFTYTPEDEEVTVTTTSLDNLIADTRPWEKSYSGPVCINFPKVTKGFLEVANPRKARKYLRSVGISIKDCIKEIEPGTERHVLHCPTTPDAVFEAAAAADRDPDEGPALLKELLTF